MFYKTPPPNRQHHQNKQTNKKNVKTVTTNMRMRRLDDEMWWGVLDEILGQKTKELDKSQRKPSNVLILISNNASV